MVETVIFPTWIPSWVAIKSSYCARYDCNNLRELGRRWCPEHVLEWEKEAHAIPSEKKLVRYSGAE